jgi:hypothetical protein
MIVVDRTTRGGVVEKEYASIHNEGAAEPGAADPIGDRGSNA